MDNNIEKYQKFITMMVNRTKDEEYLKALYTFAVTYPCKDIENMKTAAQIG